MDEKIKKAKELVDKLDTSKFISQCGTTWEVHLEDGTLYERGNFTACFAATMRSLQKCLEEGKKPKKITYFVEDRRQKENLSREERIAWYDLLKEYNIINKEKLSEELLDGGISFDITKENLSPCSLYLELSLCRYINEEPAVVKSMFLLTKVGVGFAQAIGYSQNKHGKSSGHMVLPFTGGVYGQNLVKSRTGQVLSLSNFIKNRTKMDSRKVISEVANKGSSLWKFHDMLLETNSSIQLKNSDSFLGEEISELFECDNPEDMGIKVKESKEKGDSIFV